MAGFPVTCNNCGGNLNDVNDTCLSCGPGPKTVHVEAHAQGMSSASASMSMRKVEEELKKNWPLVALLAAIYLFL